ncbi:unnamed protein product [Paramecium sonneborni]|uniref:Transmembrane protein n=1 Tax=Paramecium sonneborni TaxID=65129 RepID=A0A8S1MHZ8_9CILI|nr:unnamed protein product [Paramecium sonneborni]
MKIIKTALTLLLFVFEIGIAELLADGEQGKIYNCANIELIGLIGGDPLTIDTSKERYITFDGDVRLSHKTHKQTMDSLKEGKDYFGTNSIHYSSVQNGIYIFVIEKSQENIIQSYIKTSLKRSYKVAQIPQVFYLKTIIEGQKKYAIHQITMSDKKEMKRELFKEEKETMQSFTGLQFSKKFVNIVFATLETGTFQDFTADEKFLEGVKSILDEIQNGKKCDEFFCKPPTLEQLGQLLADLPANKIQCSKKQCTYSQGGENKILFNKIPFLQTDKNFRYLDKSNNGMLLTTITPKNQKFVSITAQLALKCNIQDYDFHSQGYSGAFQAIKIGNSKLYSALIIEPTSNGIKRKFRSQTPEMYDELNNIQNVKTIYYFMIITNKGPQELFDQIISVVEKAKEIDQKKYQCTPIPKDTDVTFIQLNSKNFEEIYEEGFLNQEEQQQQQETANIPKIELLENQNNGLCFKVFDQCYYNGSSIQICQGNIGDNEKLQTFSIQSIKLSEEMRITFQTKDKQQIILENNQECLQNAIIIDEIKVEQVQNYE